MCNRTQVGIVLSTLLLLASTPALASPETVGMSFIDSAGQTAIWRGDLSSAGSGTVNVAIILDGIGTGGSSGVFSGVDVDFVIPDRDGNLATTGDQIKPIENSSTYVTGGTIQNPVVSPYQPTATHPGVLFGLNADGSIDWDTATLDTRDGSYNALSLMVDTSDGWVSLGECGAMHTALPTTCLDGGLYLFVGDVGLSEFVCQVNVNGGGTCHAGHPSARGGPSGHYGRKPGRLAAPAAGDLTPVITCRP